MTTRRTLRSLACPTCGAPLETKLDQPTIHCQYCNALIENPEYRPPRPVVKTTAPIQFPFNRPFVNTLSGFRTACFGAIAMMVLIFVVFGVSIGSFIYSFIKSTSSSSSPHISLPKVMLFPLQIESSALMLSSNAGSPNLIAVTYDVSANGYALSRLDMGSHKALWSTLNQNDYLQVDALLAGDTYVYIVMDTRLVALQLNDGAQAWEASLSDSLPGACDHCIVYQKGQVLVLTTDNSLSAYDALTGHQTWEKRFEYVGHSLYPAGNGIVLPYSVQHMNGSIVGVFDPSSGNEIVHMEPSCKPQGGMEDNLGVDTHIIVDSSGQGEQAYLLYGMFNACIQRWDLTSGKMDWENVDTQQSLYDSGSRAILSNGVLYYVVENQLRSLDAATGQRMQILEDTQDYYLLPLFVDGQRLLVRATRHTGSTRYELWGYDLGTGKNLWKRTLLKSDPMDPPDEMSGMIDTDTSGWTYRMTTTGLWLITFQTRPNQIDLAQVKLDTGELGAQLTVPLGIDDSTDYYDIPKRINSSDNLAWYVMFNCIYAINPDAGAITYQWP